MGRKSMVVGVGCGCYLLYARCTLYTVPPLGIVLKSLDKTKRKQLEKRDTWL